MKDSSSSKTLFAFLAGAAAGAVVGLLMAPESGELTRDKLGRQADDILSDLEDQWDVGFQRIKELTDNAIAEADRLKNRGEQALNDSDN